MSHAFRQDREQVQAPKTAGASSEDTRKIAQKEELMNKAAKEKEAKKNVKPEPAPAAPPEHEDEAFRVFDGSAPQSDG